MSADKLAAWRFESKPRNFVGVAAARLIYVGVEKRADFDKIDLPCVDHGQKDRGHVLTKTLGNLTTEVSVVFQHWLNQLTPEAMMADAAEARKRKEP